LEFASGIQNWKDVTGQLLKRFIALVSIYIVHISLLCCSCFVFTVQLRLTSPGLLHDEKMKELEMRNKLHQENHPEVKQLLDTRQNKKKTILGHQGSKMVPQAGGYPKPSCGMWQISGGRWQISGGMKSFRAPAIAFRRHRIGLRIGVTNYIKTNGPIGELKVPKVSPDQGLVMQLLQNIYLIMVSCEINDATYIVDPARTEG
jgi:hypothetical protein